jgi:hypothetical protein
MSSIKSDGPPAPSPDPGTRAAAVRRLEQLRDDIAALERYCYRVGRLAHQPGLASSRSYTGLQELSPAPHNRQAAIHKLVETCLEIAHGLRVAGAGLSVPDPPTMPWELCDFPATDGRHWLAFKGAVGRLGEWADACRQALARAQAIAWLGGRMYQVGTHLAVTLEQNEHDVLQALLNAPGNVLDKPALVRISGYDDAPRVLKRLREKYGSRFAGAIQCPGARGRGGYRAHVVSLKDAPRDGAPGAGEPGGAPQR